MELTARRHAPDDPEVSDILALLRAGFAYMTGRIDPPSSLDSMTVAQLRETCRTAGVWTVGDPVVACVVLREKPDALYIGKLCVAPQARRMGHARRLIALAEHQARQRGLEALELQSRVELKENHETFRRLGFVMTGTTTHPGFDRPTSITFRKDLVALMPARPVPD
jgi:ribosomal protein S18 acetylase RimI-like enzyme